MRLPSFATHLLIGAAVAALALTPAAAQRRQPTPEQRIERLEKQVRQVQKSVFPKGQPADTAGFVDDPAATLVQANQLSARLDAIESQMSELTRASEENGNRLANMEAELARLRADQDRRLRAIENAGESGSGAISRTDPAVDSTNDSLDAAAEAADNSPPPAPRPRVETSRTTAAADPAEAAYDKGFRLWEAKKYDQAVAALRQMLAAHPDHRRASWARNLIGRSMLDKGEYRAAAEALLANYRTNKDGERAADSLYYLGQASMKLGQPAQACKAFAELENVYSATMRPALRTLLPAARAEAKCR